ncbi:hypothetical protein B0H34DRAFT_796640 [Crassisporium funariophilum]|nr:hypothetical protein B0H34DRAFT_796640 [Crassisporium funariophilum]
MATPIYNQFNDATHGDVCFQSADSKLFYLQRKNLEAHTGAFPPSEFDTHGEITPLTEESAVLDILFQFVYPKRHPDLEGLGFDIVAGVAEAAEKYEVFSAMNICCIRMRQFIPTYPAEVLAYAGKHDYPNIADEAALHAIFVPLVQVLPQLPAFHVLKWVATTSVQYHNAWTSIFDRTVEYLAGMDRDGGRSSYNKALGPDSRVHWRAWSTWIK